MNATTTRTFKVEYESRPEYQGNDWHIMDDEGDCRDSQPTERQARVRAAELAFEARCEAEAEAEAEAAEALAAEADDLRAEIDDALDAAGDDLDRLRRALAVLKG